MPQVNKAEDHVEVISWLNAAIFDDHQMKPLQFPPQSQPGMFLRHKQIGLRAISASLALGCVIGGLYYPIMINTTAATPFKYGRKTRSPHDNQQSWIVLTNYFITGPVWDTVVGNY